MSGFVRAEKGLSQLRDDANVRVSAGEHRQPAFNDVAYALATDVARADRAAPGPPIDWLAEFAAVVSVDELTSVLARLLDVLASGPATIATADAARFGEAAGRRLWALAKAKASRTSGYAFREHFTPLGELLARVDRTAPGGTGTVGASSRGVASIQALRTALERSARGLDDVGFPPVAEACTLRILVTGFDPFASRGEPGPKDWNPSGAAALALDGTTIHEPGMTVVVEAVILPNRQDAFDRGVVERLLSDAAADGVVSVGMDDTMGRRGVVRIERFMIDRQDLTTGPAQLIPAAPGGPTGAAVLEAADAQAVAAEMNRGAGSSPRALVGASVTLAFGSPGDGDAALTALGVPPPLGATVAQRMTPTVTNPAAIKRLGALAALDPATSTWGLMVGGRSPRRVTFELTDCTAGDFFCNDLAYREQRAKATAVFVHVARGAGDAQPLSASNKAVARQAVMDSVRLTVVALARVVASRR